MPSAFGMLTRPTLSTEMSPSHTGPTNIITSLDNKKNQPPSTTPNAPMSVVVRFSDEDSSVAVQISEVDSTTTWHGTTGLPQPSNNQTLSATTLNDALGNDANDVQSGEEEYDRYESQFNNFDYSDFEDAREENRRDPTNN